MQWSQRDPAFPGDKVVLTEGDGLGGVEAGGGVDEQVEESFAGLLDGLLAVDDGASVEVDDVGHAGGEVGAGADFDGGCDGVAGGGAETGGEDDQVAAGGGQGGRGFDVVAWGAAEGEPASGADGLAVVDDADDGAGTAFFGSAGGFDGVGDEAIADVAGAGVGVEAGAAGLSGGFVGAHEVDEFVCEFGRDTAVAETLFDAAEFGEFGEDGGAAKGSEEIGGVAYGGVGRDAGEAVGATALDAEGEVAEGAGFTGLFIGGGHAEESVADGVGDHLLLGAAFLLFEEVEGFVEVGVERVEFGLEEGDLGVLAAKGQDGGTGDVGVGDVTGEEAAEGLGVLAGAAAAHGVIEELETGEVGEEGCGRRRFGFESKGAEVCG